MKNFVLFASLALALTATAFAQRGGGHGNMGGAMGNGSMGTMNHGDMGPGMSNGRSNQSGMPQSSSRTMGQQAPDTALTKSPKLSSNLEKLLPSGMTAQQACSGFKNLGQCVAAIHVSHNLDIPFADLKSKMTGTTPEPLGKAIQTLKPSANAKSEAKKGHKQADQDLSEGES